jgi:hypothetical protein
MGVKSEHTAAANLLGCVGVWVCLPQRVSEHGGDGPTSEAPVQQQCALCLCACALVSVIVLLLSPLYHAVNKPRMVVSIPF